MFEEVLPERLLIKVKLDRIGERDLKERKHHFAHIFCDTPVTVTDCTPGFQISRVNICLYFLVLAKKLYCVSRFAQKQLLWHSE